MNKPERKEYRLWLNAEESIPVFADEVSVTGNGDILFQTFTEVTGVDLPVNHPPGQPLWDKSIALMQASGTWHRFEQMVNGNPLWKQSGKIKAVAAVG